MARVYCDTSCCFSLHVQDVFTERAAALFGRLADRRLLTITSTWTLAEFASALGAYVRRDELTSIQARAALGAFERSETWRDAVAVADEDVRSVAASIRRFDLNLRAPDGLHLMIALRAGAAFATFDAGQAEAARAFGLEVVDT